MLGRVCRPRHSPCLGPVHSHEKQSAERITTRLFCEGQHRSCPWTGNAEHLCLNTFPRLLEAQEGDGSMKRYIFVLMALMLLTVPLLVGAGDQGWMPPEWNPTPPAR